jgi:hypothetical protein
LFLIKSEFRGHKFLLRSARFFLRKFNKTDTCATARRPCRADASDAGWCAD